MTRLAATALFPHPEQVFWAMPADFQLLADYGIDVSNPVNHQACLGSRGKAHVWLGLMLLTSIRSDGG